MSASVKATGASVNGNGVSTANEQADVITGASVNGVPSPATDLLDEIEDKYHDRAEARVREYDQPNILEEKSLWGRITFYIYHTMLIIVYSIYSVIRMTQYAQNKLRIKFLNLAYNPAKTPQIIRDDVLKLSKLPKRLSALMEYIPEEIEGGGYYGLMNDASELVAWTVSAGISSLSIYEFDGVIKCNIEDLRVNIHKKLTDYFSPQYVPTFVIKVPHLNTSYYGLNHDNDEHYKLRDMDIEISILSREDGKETIVELTRTMAELAVKKEISPKDVTVSLIDKELTELVGEEPDLIIFFHPVMNLMEYPPWHIRLSEFYWEPDNDAVTYAIFLRALQKYSTCKINVGK